MDTIKQSTLNLGTLGHIDHGKTSLVKAITHKWTDTHSESLKRNMTIKLGYADAIIRKCEGCEGTSAYTTLEKCPKCGRETKPIIRISLLDAPGHETLMATAIAAANMINGILFVIAANEPCPMQQTREHLMIINLLGIKNAIIVQTKVDIVGRAGAIENYKQIKAFIKGSSIENAPIVPVMTNLNVNVDMVLEMIVNMPRPKFDENADPLMYIARSFDINKPGSEVDKLEGGVIGGTLVRGMLKVGDMIEVRPGISREHTKREVYEPIMTPILSISNGTDELDSAVPGGLIGLSTEIDPSFTKADSLVGNIVGKEGRLPPTVTNLAMKYHKFERSDVPEKAITENEPLILSIGTAAVVSYVKKVKRDNIEVDLKRPIATEKGAKIAIMRNMGQRWRLSGYGIIS